MEDEGESESDLVTSCVCGWLLPVGLSLSGFIGAMESAELHFECPKCSSTIAISGDWEETAPVAVGSA